MANGGPPAADTPAPSLPDPSAIAKTIALVLLVAAGVLAVAADGHEPPFVPLPEVEFSWFAGFLLAATIIERVLELIAPFFPFWGPPAGTPADQKIAQKKADRGYIMLTLGALLGVIASAVSGLYLLEAIGFDVGRGLDMMATGLAISGGSKTFHELVKALQKVKGDGTTAG